MRDELNRNLIISGVRVGLAVDKVEEEVGKWGCEQYMHITRPMSVSGSSHDGQVIHLETLFSKPTQDRPVPIAAVCVFFNLNTTSGNLTYQFEQECVQHEVGGQSLAPEKFSMWLDRIIGDKLQVRCLHDLATPFEETRLAPPPMPSEHPSEEEGEPEVLDEPPKSEAYVSERKPAPGQQVEEKKLPLNALLANIFDAADEEDEFELTHKEVAELLYATPLGLADWDIKLLLTTATELETGRIEYRPFVQAAPEIIEALLKRRSAYQERKKDAIQVNLDAIELCFGEEIEEISRAAREAFTAQDTSGKGSLSRHEFRSCLLSKSDRFSSQEVQMLMQMCKEDDFGQVPYDEFSTLLQTLRIDALHNALVETDIGALRIHLILLMRREGLTDDDGALPIWTLRKVLLDADQLCLSRMQIHVILSIVHPDQFGEVDVDYFLRVCCTVIPNMFDTTAFMEKAGQIAKDKADAQAKQEEEELKGITSSLAAKRRAEDEEQEDEKANAPDRDAVEKALILVGNTIEHNRQQSNLDVMKFLEAMHHEQVSQCQLSESELRGFIAEAVLDERNEVQFNDHIKSWVPILFEMRKSRVYDTILNQDWGFHARHLINLDPYELDFPLRIRDHDSDKGGRRRTGRFSTSGRRKSTGRLNTGRFSGRRETGRLSTGRFSTRRNTAAFEEIAMIASEMSGRRVGRLSTGRSSFRRDTRRVTGRMGESSGRSSARRDTRRQTGRAGGGSRDRGRSRDNSGYDSDSGGSAGSSRPGSRARGH